jgi:hypothetical protein
MAMSMQRFGNHGDVRAISLSVAICTSILFGSTALGQFSGEGGRHGGGGHDREARQSNRPDVDLLPAPVTLTPHGGEYLKSKPNHYEIVYMPLQARIYLFDDKMKPLTARDIHAQMSPNVPQQNVPRKIPFRHVAAPAGGTEQDYVVAVFDFRQLTDKETSITLEFSGLPNNHKYFGLWDSHDGTASVKSSFSPSKIRPYVARVLFTEADDAGFRRQNICPVSGKPLGIDRPAVKVYIADYPLYLWSEDCIAMVKQSPEKYLPHPSTPISGR